MYKKIILLLMFFCNSNCYSVPSIINLKCNDYLNSLNNNNKILSNIKDILKLKNGKYTMDYNELIMHNHNKNLKEIMIENNKNIIKIKLNDNTEYNYHHGRKIDIIGLLNIIFYLYHS